MEPALYRVALCRVLCATLAVAAWLLCSVAAPAAAGPAASKYEADMSAFVAEVDKTYPFLDLKGIRADWSAAKVRLAASAKACRSDADFLGLVLDAIRVLRDAHMDLSESKAKPAERPPQYYPGLSFLPAVDNAVVVMVPPQGNEKTLPAGTVVTEIDGKNARQVLEERTKKAWAQGGPFSSPQRARLFEYRVPLAGPVKGEQHRITYLEGRTKKTVALASAVEARGWPHAYNMPAGLAAVGRSFQYAKLPSGVGYMYIRRVDESTGPGMAEALAKVTGAKGWIVDLRGNGGGGYDDTVIKAIQAFPQPVAVLIDAGCISAGETLARDFARYAKARLFGSTTAGSSSSKQQWAFPSGITSITFSVRSRQGADGKPIEFNGIAPDATVEEVPAEMARGQNSCILRAEEYLLKKP